MNNEQFLTSLTPEQSPAFILLRDEIMAANLLQNKELGAVKDAEIDGLKSKLADNDNTIVQLTTERDALKSLLAQAKQLYVDQNHDALAALIIETDKPAKQKALEEAQAELEAAQAKLQELQNS